MRIIIYSETNAASIAQNMGKAEYSYYFILEKYLPILTALGDIFYVSDPASEVDRLYAEAGAAGDKAVFLSFTPPHRTAKNLKCPMICVLAWEYGSIPNETWDPEEPWNNWVEAIREIGNVITISDYATRVIRAQVGYKPTVVTIPAPVVPGESAWQRFTRGFSYQGSQVPPRPESRGPLTLSADLFDSRQMTIDEEKVLSATAGAEVSRSTSQPWGGGAVEWTFTSGSDDDGQQLVGFYDQEQWGVWSRTIQPMLLLPWAVEGELEVLFDLIPYGENEGQTVRVSIGDEVQDIVLESGMKSYQLSFSLSKSATSIAFSGFRAIADRGARDHRTLGIGLRSLSLRRPDESSATASKVQSNPLTDDAGNSESILSLSGTVYTAVFNPADGRKNWGDIVTAFCWTFREQPDKTLVLKMSHSSRSVFLGRLFLLFSRLSPFQCRVVAIHGYLPSDQLGALIASTDYFVNASTAEGQCLPLLEFMAQGVPAIAPDHTAMETYINSKNAFVIRSSEQPAMWPHDPRRAKRTLSYRTDWESLACAYRDSDLLLTENIDQYEDMRRAAADAVSDHYSSRKIGKQLKRLLHKVARRK